jgi:death-on-curing protein
VKILKVRRVGNSNVVSLPREFEAAGYGPGASVLVEQLEDGSLHLVRTDELRDLIRSSGKRLIAKHRQALEILAGHDRGDPVAWRVTDEGNETAFLYLDADDVVALYADIFNCTVDEAGDQLRSRSGLEGAVARPRGSCHVWGACVALQAAVLAQGIAESQVFVDGNKRTALISLLTFLDINGWMLDADDVALASWILDLSQGLSAEELAQRLRGALAETK